MNSPKRRLGEQVLKVRSKNAGPYWVTVDIFCGTSQAYATLLTRLHTHNVARLYGAPLPLVKRFDIVDLNVIKFSFPRPEVPGPAKDRNMHGGQWAHLLDEMLL